MIITNARYALVGSFITLYPTRAHGIIVIFEFLFLLKIRQSKENALEKNNIRAKFVLTKKKKNSVKMRRKVTFLTGCACLEVA